MYGGRGTRLEVQPELRTNQCAHEESGPERRGGGGGGRRERSARQGPRSLDFPFRTVGVTYTVSLRAHVYFQVAGKKFEPTHKRNRGDVRRDWVESKLAEEGPTRRWANAGRIMSERLRVESVWDERLSGTKRGRDIKYRGAQNLRLIPSFVLGFAKLHCRYSIFGRAFPRTADICSIRTYCSKLIRYFFSSFKN